MSINNWSKKFIVLSESLKEYSKNYKSRITTIIDRSLRNTAIIKEGHETFLANFLLPVRRRFQQSFGKRKSSFFN